MAGAKFCQERSGRKAPEQGALCEGLSQGSSVWSASVCFWSVRFKAEKSVPCLGSKEVRLQRLGVWGGPKGYQWGTAQRGHMGWGQQSQAGEWQEQICHVGDHTFV